MMEELSAKLGFQHENYTVYIGPATNNITEYEVVISLLTEAASQDVCNLVVLMESQLVVFHLHH